MTSSFNSQARFGGVVKIVRFNVRFYLVSVASLAAATLAIASRRLSPSSAAMVLCVAAAVAFWTFSSLLVSWYVYDHARVTHWDWLPSRLPLVPRSWANIHAGLDESTSRLRQLLPCTQGCAVDIYDAGEMTEASIARARRIHPASEPFRRGTYDALPLPENSCDAVFILFAAHELRNEEHRKRLLSQTVRVLHENGCVVLVEHLRDWKNFVAFGPGFLHFYSRRNWVRNIREAGLIIAQTKSVTPFVECFVLRRADV